MRLTSEWDVAVQRRALKLVARLSSVGWIQRTVDHWVESAPLYSSTQALREVVADATTLLYGRRSVAQMSEDRAEIVGDVAHDEAGQRVTRRLRPSPEINASRRKEFIDSKRIIRKYAQTRGRTIVIRVFGKFPLSEQAERFFELAGQVIGEAGFRLNFSFRQPHRTLQDLRLVSAHVHSEADQSLPAIPASNYP